MNGPSFPLVRRSHKNTAGTVVTVVCWTRRLGRTADEAAPGGGGGGGWKVTSLAVSELWPRYPMCFDLQSGGTSAM